VPLYKGGAAGGKEGRGGAAGIDTWEVDSGAGEGEVEKARSKNKVGEAALPASRPRKARFLVGEGGG